MINPQESTIPLILYFQNYTNPFLLPPSNAIYQFEHSQSQTNIILTRNISIFLYGSLFIVSCLAIKSSHKYQTDILKARSEIFRRKFINVKAEISALATFIEIDIRTIIL